MTSKSRTLYKGDRMAACKAHPLATLSCKSAPPDHGYHGTLKFPKPWGAPFPPDFMGNSLLQTSNLEPKAKVFNLELGPIQFIFLSLLQRYCRSSQLDGSSFTILYPAPASWFMVVESPFPPKASEQSRFTQGTREPPRNGLDMSIRV